MIYSPADAIPFWKDTKPLAPTKKVQNNLLICVLINVLFQFTHICMVLIRAGGLALAPN